LNGIHHIVRRHASPGSVLLKVGIEEFAAAREEDVRSLLPIHAYSQKQLSSVSVRLDELTRFVTSPIRSQLDRIDAQAAALAGRLRANYVSLQRQRALQASIRRNELTSRSLLQQAANLRDSLGVVSDEDRTLLAQKPGYDVADELAASWARKLEQGAFESASFADRILALHTELRSVADDAPEKETLKKIETAVRAALDELRETADRAGAIVETARAADNTYSQAAEEWNRARADFETKYSAAKQRSAAHQTKLDELTQVEVQGRKLRESLDRDREELARLGDPATVHAEFRSEWVQIREERSRCVREQCNALTSLSGGLIRATLVRGAGLRDMAERFRAAITGSGLRAVKIELFFDRLVSENNPLAVWEDVLSELEPVQAQDGGNSTRASFPTLARLGLAGPDLEKVLGRLSPDGWLDLALALVDDHPSFQYKTKDAEYMQFVNASAGQQATALLRVLLNQGGPPLIIDQPEEDLDSQVVLQVVEQIWAAKKRRQLIFSSHNPNLVVNGDAELVICCDYRAAGDQSGGRIKLEGAIDLPDVRREITSVMEGGEKTFRLRKEKYGF
jgi:type III restriction enzyme